MTRILYAARGYVLAALLGVLVWARARSDATLAWEFLPLILLGLALRAWAGAHIGVHSNGLRLQTPYRAKGGPYRFLGHPLYLSNLLMAGGLIGFAHVPNRKLNWGLGLAVFAQHIYLMAREERAFKKIGEVTQREQSTFHEQNSFQGIWIRQGRNLFYAGFSTFLLWVAAQWR